MKITISILLTLALCTAALAAPQIPALHWTPCSDWVNVKTDITPKAVGDGVADDTAALQAGLNGMTHGATLFLPAGTYRITNSLLFKPHGRLEGILIIGEGRDTKIVWDGKAGGTMWQDYAAANSRYAGLLLDGKGVAANGLHHAGGEFETEVQHRDMAFLNFTGTGLLADKEPATAETITENCLFEHCGRGIGMMTFNTYDYTIDGCEFRQCGTGVESQHGNYYLRNCHFEGSRVIDVLSNSEHGSSIRRCTSLGAKAFAAQMNPASTLTIQDCRISGWTDAAAAIVCAGAPVTLFDCVFANPPGKTPPIAIRDAGQILLVSGNSSPATGDVVVQPGAGKVYSIPAGKRTGTLTSATQSFLRETESVPGVVFDAKRDFGAKGNGVADDTLAVQHTIDAARAQGHGALAYLPTGRYIITSTLLISGADYRVGGSGFGDGLHWKGQAGGTIIEVRDPLRVTLQNINVGSHDVAVPMNNAIDILQTDSGKPSFMSYDNVTVFGMYQKKPLMKGLWLRGLGKDAVVVAPHIEGNIHLLDCARATVLLNNTYEGAMTIEGKGKLRDGFTGALTHLGTIVTHALYVKDNQSFTASDFYVEQSDNGYLFQGADDDPPGRITLQCPKLQMPKPDAVAYDIRNYGGQITCAPVQYYCEPATMQLNQQGTRPVNIILAGCSFYSTRLVPNLTGAAHLSTVGNYSINGKLESTPADNHYSPETLQALAVALDDLRKLGDIDVRLNHPEAMPAGHAK